MFSKEAALLQQIADSRAAIRQKHLQLKHGLENVQEHVSKVLQPIVQPLNKTAKNPFQITVKNEPVSSDDEESKKKIFHSTPWKKKISKIKKNDSFAKEKELFDLLPFLGNEEMPEDDKFQSLTNNTSEKNNQTKVVTTID